ncbi:DUF1592 domain-containing protein [Polyangium spumosum]|uniref:DUF1592 domain-containing protein n=1 Tax=Polyangium spumosum TaxID=889282 RepID=A0A6N7Q325_9BACT|nr:DUF1592 domain-containing protein [Polyangium spumosum]MRG98087.1 DUF1592 domain-containing protein [Polyangium spumosum]
MPRSIPREPRHKRRGFPIPPLVLVAVLAPAAFGCSDDAATPGTDPGRVTMHRLNRAEYNNTVRDLLGTTLRPADDFPADDRGYGFDNIADVLSISPLQAELYARAAEDLAREAMHLPSPSTTLRVEAETLTGQVGQASGDDWNLWSGGELPLTHEFPSTGTYRIAARVWGDQAGPDPVKMNLVVGGAIAGSFDVSATSANAVVVEAEASANAGTQVVSVEFTNDYYDPDLGADRNLHVDWIEIEGPLGVVGKNPIRERIVVCDPTSGATCVREILQKFAERAFRRPVGEAEIDKLVGVVALAEAQGQTPSDGIEIALRAILTSPHFLFRPELDPDPNADAPAHPLNDFELASRLSYFLWSSMPDEELFAAAREGKLQDPAEIEAQVERMLADPKAEALVDNFAGQWLFTRALDDHQPDYHAFPKWNATLRESMRQETRLFFEEFLRSDLPIPRMLTADFTYIDQALATHYEIKDFQGEGFVRVTLQDPNRKGLLAQGSILTVTSFPTRTSPVKRGKWIMTQMLCTEPDAPPPGVEGLVTEEVPTGSIRQRLEIHRANPICAGCHEEMDNLGFGFENFDGIGSFRTVDLGFPVDSSGVLPGGKTFDGLAELSGILAEDPRFLHCVSEQMLTYALGRGHEAADADDLEHMTKELGDRGETFAELIKLVATSEPFRMRRGEAPGGAK